MKRIAPVIVVVLVAAVAPEAGAGTRVDITIVDLDFDPDTVTGLTTNPQDPARQHPLFWTNTDDTQHKVVEDQDQQGIRLRTELLSPDEVSDAVRVKFAAGWRYVCSIHPTSMSGAIRVRPALYEPGEPGNYRVTNGPNGEAILRLANADIPETYVFDVQRRIGDGRWRMIRNDIRRKKVALSPNADGIYRFRVRIQHTANGRRTDWSPASKTLTVT